ncbi:nucleotidyltransferase domain-containing protein [Propionibacteriaceae bacterium Y1685]
MSTSSPAGPPAPHPASARPLGPEEFDRWYGGWDPLTPRTIADFMEGFDRPWWIIGGWSLEAYSGISRSHEDMDISILSSDAEAFRLFLGDAWTPWNVDDGWFRPFDHRFTDVRPDSQVWVRRNAQSPWVLDVPFTPSTGGRWTNKRHLSHTEDLDDVSWVAEDGLRYARPEVTLMFKAAQAREKDRVDARNILPLLDSAAKAWLRETIARVNPDHEWVGTL